MMPCKVHTWVTNSGQGGEPKFVLNRQMSAQLIMHVKCQGCGVRTWFTEAQWRAIPTQQAQA